MGSNDISIDQEWSASCVSHRIWSSSLETFDGAQSILVGSGGAAWPKTDSNKAIIDCTFEAGRLADLSKVITAYASVLDVSQVCGQVVFGWRRRASFVSAIVELITLAIRIVLAEVILGAGSSRRTATLPSFVT